MLAAGQVLKKKSTRPTTNTLCVRSSMRLGITMRGSTVASVCDALFGWQAQGRIEAVDAGGDCYCRACALLKGASGLGTV